MMVATGLNDLLDNSRFCMHFSVQLSYKVSLTDGQDCITRIEAELKFLHLQKMCLTDKNL